jgi:hypothetical protein
MKDLKHHIPHMSTDDLQTAVWLLEGMEEHDGKKLDHEDELFYWEAQAELSKREREQKV